jgi:hypothetical protein
MVMVLQWEAKMEGMNPRKWNSNIQPNTTATTTLQSRNNFRGYMYKLPLDFVGDIMNLINIQRRYKHIKENIEHRACEF